jgi:hypothetical protein
VNVCVRQATNAPGECNTNDAMSPSGNCYLVVSNHVNRT